MEPDRGSFDGLVCASILPSLKKHWKEEIEHAIDKIKLGQPGQRKRTDVDRWFRRMWYISLWRMRNVKGPSVTRD